MVFLPQQIFNEVIGYCGDLKKTKQIERHGQLVNHINMFSKDWTYKYYSSMNNYGDTPTEVAHNYITLKWWKEDADQDFKVGNFYDECILEYLIKDDLEDFNIDLKISTALMYNRSRIYEDVDDRC